MKALLTRMQHTMLEPEKEMVASLTAAAVFTAGLLHWLASSP